MMHRLAERPDLDTSKKTLLTQTSLVRIVRTNEITYRKFDKMVDRNEITELNFANKVVTSGSK